MRHLEVVRRLKAEGPLTVEQLCAAADVSPATMRRDLDALQAEGLISRVRGGAVLRTDGADADATRPFASVVGADTEDKASVARVAANLVADGDVVLLDIGTTTMMLAQRLRRRPITVVTASLAVLDVLREDTNVDLILLGGQVRRPYHSLVGSLTEDSLRQVCASIAFIGASGIRPDGTVLDSTAVEVPVKRSLLRAADRGILLADRHKFPGSGALRVCTVSDLAGIVTNEGADPDTLAAARDAGVDVWES
jgi:DeoR/GlpR family transcriptional regulator of sugar metabolism